MIDYNNAQWKPESGLFKVAPPPQNSLSLIRYKVSKGINCLRYKVSKGINCLVIESDNSLPASRRLIFCSSSLPDKCHQLIKQILCSVRTSRLTQQFWLALLDLSIEILLCCPIENFHYYFCFVSQVHSHNLVTAVSHTIAKLHNSTVDIALSNTQRGDKSVSFQSISVKIFVFILKT